ncbi:MAG: prepilin-type N-terminal cleavage/methylation domain-containing protein, partial [Firmicutes bacterium]|nr:prepilin-type N-terminal cleavage/methylation domain-containing protein [Candidatus Colimorpha enterica]
MINKSHNAKRGFTLVECIIAIAVISIITMSAVLIFKQALDFISGQWNNYQVQLTGDNILSTFQATEDKESFAKSLEEFLGCAHNGDEENTDVLTVFGRYSEYDMSSEMVAKSFKTVRVFDRGKVQFFTQPSSEITADTSPLAELVYVSEQDKSNFNSTDKTRITDNTSIYKEMGAGGGEINAITVCYYNYVDSDKLIVGTLNHTRGYHFAAYKVYRGEGNVIKVSLTYDYVSLKDSGLVYDNNETHKVLERDATPIEKYLFEKGYVAVFNYDSGSSADLITGSGRRVFPVYYVDDDGNMQRVKKDEKTVYLVVDGNTKNNTNRDWDNGRYYSVDHAKLVLSDKTAPSEIWSEVYGSLYSEYEAARTKAYNDTYAAVYEEAKLRTLLDFTARTEADLAANRARDAVGSYDNYLWNNLPAVEADISTVEQSFDWYGLPIFCLHGEDGGENCYTLNTSGYASNHHYTDGTFPKGGSFSVEKGDVYPISDSIVIDGTFISRYHDYELKDPSQSNLCYVIEKDNTLAIYSRPESTSDVGTLLYTYNGSKKTDALNLFGSNCEFVLDATYASDGTRYCNLVQSLVITKVVCANKKITFYSNSSEIFCFNYDNSDIYSSDKESIETGSFKEFYGDGGTLNITNSAGAKVNFKPGMRWDNKAAAYVLTVSFTETDGTTVTKTIFTGHTTSVESKYVDLEAEAQNFVESAEELVYDVYTKYYTYYRGKYALLAKAVFSANVSSTSTAFDPSIKIWFISTDEL